MEKILLKPSKKIDPNNDKPDFIEGTQEENIICAFMGLSLNSKKEITAAQLLTIFIEIQKTIYAGVLIDFKVQPRLKNSKILKAVLTLKGNNENFLGESFFLAMVKFLCQGNEKFFAEAKQAYTEFDAKLLISQFMA